MQYLLDQGLLRAELRAALKPAGRPGTPDQPGHRRARPAARPGGHARHPARPARHPGAVPGREQARLRRLLARAAARAKPSWSCWKHAIADEPPATLQNTGVIRPGYSSELDGVIEASRHAREWIANLESVERERTGIKSLKVGYNKVFGYYIEITRANDGMVPAGIHPQADPGQRRALHHPGDERIRDAGAQRRGAHPARSKSACSARSASSLARASRAPAEHRPRPGRAGCAGLAGRGRRAGRLRPPGGDRRRRARDPRRAPPGGRAHAWQRRALRAQRCRSSSRARSCASSPGRT